MISRWTLGAYLARQYLLWFCVFLGTLASIIYLFEVAELARRAAHSDIAFDILLRMGLYKLPETIEHVLPFVVLFSGMFTFWRLTRNQELTIARTAGLSAWQFLAPALLVTLVFSGLNLSVINPLGAHFSNRFKQLEMRYLEHAPLMELTGAGLWLRQRDDGHRYLIHADHVKADPMTLTPVIIFIFDPQDHYQGRIDAPSAILRDGYWEMDGGWINMDQKAPQAVEHYHLATSLTLDKIQESMAPPNTISFWELPAFIEALRSIGLPPVRHELEFQSLLAQPVLLCAMVFFAALFSLRMSRRGHIMETVLLGAILGISVFVLNNIVAALGANQNLPVMLAAWGIPLAALSLSNAVLLHMEDG